MNKIPLAAPYLETLNNICPYGPVGENNEMTAYLWPRSRSLYALGLNVFIFLFYE